MNKVWVVGSLNMDLIFTVERIPTQGETLHSNHFMMEPGGKGANQAVTCSQLKSDVSFIGCVGDDIFGQRLLEELEAHHIETQYIKTIQDEATGIAGIIVNHGDNRIIINSGANKHLHFKQVKDILSKEAKQGDVFLTQLEIPLETVKESLAYAKKLGLKTILNPAPAKSLPKEIYQYIDIIIPNEVEAEMLSGVQTNDSAFNHKVIDFFLDKGIKDVVITKGNQGSIYGSQSVYKSFGTYDVKPVDSTGAGDAFVATIACQLAKGKKVEDSIAYASAVSAMVVSKMGAQASIPSLSDVKDFMKDKEDLHIENNH